MAVGIIAEYNPFHNGHLYHLNKIKEKYPNEEIVLVINGNFTQRGDVSLINKWKKTVIAKEAGIDLIVELPFPFATQSADFFSYGAITILEKLRVEKFVFGSESDDIDTLTTIAKIQVNNADFDKLVKLYSKFGESYPTAISKAIYDLTGEHINTPNDLLGISYIKTIIKYNYNIKPEIIKRENNYHSNDIKSITSSTAIRQAIKKNIDISNTVPAFVSANLSKKDLHFIDDYFNLLKYKIITSNDLEDYQTVDEGLDHLLKKVILRCTNYDELTEKLKSKRYTYNKISRMLLHILIGFTKDDAKNMKEISYIRVLGFNDKGQNYLNKIKKSVDVPILSKFERNNKMLDLELKATIIYSIPKNEAVLISEEYKNHLKKELVKMD